MPNIRLMEWFTLFIENLCFLFEHIDEICTNFAWDLWAGREQYGTSGERLGYNQVNYGSSEEGWDTNKISMDPEKNS